MGLNCAYFNLTMEGKLLMQVMVVRRMMGGQLDVKWGVSHYFYCLYRNVTMSSPITERAWWAPCCSALYRRGV